jgi:hypothetical protein
MSERCYEKPRAIAPVSPFVGLSADLEQPTFVFDNQIRIEKCGRLHQPITLFWGK